MCSKALIDVTKFLTVVSSASLSVVSVTVEMLEYKKTCVRAGFTLHKGLLLPGAVFLELPVLLPKKWQEQPAYLWLKSVLWILVNSGLSKLCGSVIDN